MKPSLKHKRGHQPCFDKPHIFINNRGMIFFNKAYINEVSGYNFEIYENNNIITFLHSEGDFIIKNVKGAYITQNKPLGDYLKDKIENSFFLEKTLFGFTAYIKIKEQLKSLKVNDTIYSITGLKNYINTLKKRSESSSKEKSRKDNQIKYKSVLTLAKKSFPSEFLNY